MTPEAAPQKVVEVAVAVIEGPGHSVLLAQRPPGKPMAGYWEFPGGKLEPGETVFEALRREIDEELGIEIESADPWVVLPFVYPHAHVRLHFMRVPRFKGEPRSREGQAFRFEPINQWSAEPWLPGALPLKRWLQLPDFYAISNAAELGVEPFIERFRDHFDPTLGCWLQLREPLLSEALFEKLFEAVHGIARCKGVTLLVNSRHPEKYWHRADGVHLSAHDLHVKGRGLARLAIASCHDARDLELAAASGCDAAMLGNVGATSSHPGREGLGWTGWRSLTADCALPVFALGGLNADLATLKLARAHGAHGVAAQRAFWR
jgi:8-oxo-dGTP diphosphatase